jgi:hypothetical protein
MKTTTLLILPLLILFAACTVTANSPSAAEEAPKIPGITKVEPGTKIDDIKSDDFDMKKVVIDGGVMKIDVSYPGGAKEHEFTLYWNGIVARSYPGKTTVVLKHNANGDNAEALLTETLQFDLAKMNKPMIITAINDHGDKHTVQYGESKLD